MVSLIISGLESLSLALAEQLDHSFQSIEAIQNDLIDQMKNRNTTSTADLVRQMAGYDVHRHLKDQISTLPHIDAIVITDPNGKLINFSRSWPIPPKCRDILPAIRCPLTPMRTLLAGTHRLGRLRK